MRGWPCRRFCFERVFGAGFVVLFGVVGVVVLLVAGHAFGDGECFGCEAAVECGAAWECGVELDGDLLDGDGDAVDLGLVGWGDGGDDHDRRVVGDGGEGLRRGGVVVVVLPWCAVERKLLAVGRESHARLVEWSKLVEV